MEEFENIIVFIEDEKMLEEVRNLLQDKNQLIDEGTFKLSPATDFNYLFYYHRGWGLSIRERVNKLITLEEFKTLINENI